MEKADIGGGPERYEPGQTGSYGADGIPREGMVERYATALWRDDPAAFWLHPEGPLSDTTPDEYFVPRPEPTALDMMNQTYAGLGMLNSYANASAMAQYQGWQASAYNGSRNYQQGIGSLGLFGFLR